MEQLVILLVVGAIGLIKWVLEKSAEQRAKRETEERLGRLGDAEPVAHPLAAPRPTAFDPERDFSARRLREALGLPEESDLPAPRPMAAPPLPATFRVDEIKAIPAASLEKRVAKSTLPTRRRMPARSASQPSLVEGPAIRGGLDELLRSREGLRKAVLAQEILGTPKGLVF